MGRLWALHSEVRTWERLLLRTEGLPYPFVVRLKSGKSVFQYITKESLENLWDTRDLALQLCKEMGFEEDAKDIMSNIDKRHKEIVDDWSKIPEVFLK